MADAVDLAAREHEKHLARYATTYDGKGGVKWQDDGGLSCNCGWTAPPDSRGFRPWGAWHRHVAEAVMAHFIPTDVDAETLARGWRLAQDEALEAMYPASGVERTPFDLLDPGSRTFLIETAAEFLSAGWRVLLPEVD